MKAIIPAAGKGTRFLPATRAIPKEMLPIGAKPAIHCIVEEALAAGADDTVIVISRDKEIIRRYFEGDPELSGKVSFVYQDEQRGLGHAVLQAAEKAEGPEPVLILLGDAVVTGPNPSAQMAQVSKATGGASVIGVEQVPMEKVSRYGIVAVEGDAPDAGGHARMVDIVEKPGIEEAPSNLAVAGRYLLNADIFDYLASQQPGHGGEIQLTDAIRRMLSVNPAYGFVYSGKRQDIGNPAGYFAALEAFYGNR